MKFSDIINLFRQGKSTARSHIKNLIEVAVADGILDLIEYDLLKKIANRNQIAENDLKAIHQSTRKIKFVLPKDKLEKFRQFYDLVHMMTIDSSIHEEEMKLCNLFVVKFGYRRDRADELIRSIQLGIKNGEAIDDTLKNLECLQD